MPNQIVVRPPFRKRGQNWFPASRSLRVGSAIGSGGVVVGGAATVRFVHGSQVESDIVLEWDLDNDGDFDEAVEDVTTFATSVETFTGRDWPSLLTGKAGPGRLRVTLSNDDDRFNYFNTDSPLVTPPFSLKTGRKIRVRTTAAANPDPTPIARDRFRRALGPLGMDEFGKAYIEPLAADFSVFSSRAVASTEGDPHMALVDTGATDYYVQVKISVLGDVSPANRVGLVYRYVDTSNYSLCVIDPTTGGVQLVDVVAGVENVLAFAAAELYSGVTIGVLVDGADVAAYLEGVPVASAAAPAGSSTAELVGFYAFWATADTRPEIDEFFAWSGIPVESEGVLWTGDVSESSSSVSAGPIKMAMVSGEGWLSKLSSQEITPPASLNGRKTGLLMGNALAKALQLHPPGQIDLGVATTGPFAMPERSALAVARDVEEIEFGFLYETQEGPLSFRDRTHRDGAVSVAAFTDDPDGQFHYHSIEPYDWRKEVFNRVLAGVSPWTEGAPATLYTDPGPYNLAPGESQTIQATYDGTVVRYTGHTRDVTAPGGNPGGISVTDYTEIDPADATQTVAVPLPATINANSLILIVFAVNPTNGGNGVLSVPAGFEDVTLGSLAVAAKVAVGTEGGTSVSFVTGGNLGSTNAVQVFIVDDWIGELSGVTVSDMSMSVLGTTYDPPSVTFPWGALPTLVIPCTYWTADLSVTADATGYSDGQLTETLSGDDLGLYSAQKIVTGMASEDPGVFTVSGVGNNAYSRTIAVQGPVTTVSVSSGNPSGADPVFEIEYDASLGGTAQTHANIVVTGVPLVQGDQTFAQADDFDSQDDHNAIRTYQAAASLFANPTDAQEYADLVLSKFANDRPIVSISFYANKSAAYRKQALARRVGDKITLVATNNAGLGISQDFFVESVAHRWSHGNRLWETTWELSPG